MTRSCPRVEHPAKADRKAVELVATIDPADRAMVLLAAECGLRLGELLALTRGDVDLVHGKLRVDKQKQELSNGQGIVVRPRPRPRRGSAPSASLRSSSATWRST